jgi:hypothetical protein
MPELQGNPLHPLRRQQTHIGPRLMLAFMGEEFLVGHRRQVLTSHFTHRYRPLEDLAIRW